MIDARGIEGLASAGAQSQEDRTQISEPQVESLHKCALHCFSAQGLRVTAPDQAQIITSKFSIPSISYWSTTPNHTF